MSNLDNNTPTKDFEQVLDYILTSHNAVFKTVNTALIDLYWQVGKILSHKIEKEQWGKGVIEHLAAYIKSNAPQIRGFSDKNLWRMRQFYDAYRDNEKLSTLVREVSWSHNLAIFSRCKNTVEREYYLNQTVTDGYTVRELNRQISSSLFERAQLSDKKLSTSLRELPESTRAVFKDHYVLEFLGLPDTHNENDLQQQLVSKMKSFVLELGADFIFIDQEYKLQVGHQDFFIDLLFYHRGLQCLVAFELKVDAFKPEHIGKLNFYLEALDRDVKKEHENPSIGILLCKDKDDDVVEYALSRNLSPAMVAQYHLQLPDKKMIKEKLHEIIGNFKEDSKS
jgi:predicted nuclease of restriction endonuclease-like (RecB) superfamily